LAVESVEYSALACSLDGSSTHYDRGKGLHVYRRHESGVWRLIMDVSNSDSAVSKPI
jgi:ketosteroid isomerase-like protein